MSAENLIALRKRRSTYKGNMTKLSKRIQEFETLKPADLDETTITQQLAAWRKTNDAFTEIQQALINNYANSVDVDEEISTLEQHETDVSNAERALRDLLTVHRADNLTSVLRRSLETCERGISDDNISACSAQIQRMCDKLDIIQPMVCSGAATRYEALQTSIDDIAERLFKLQTSSAKATAMSTIVSSPVSVKRDEAFHIPHLPIPQFHGNSMEWSSFWQSFVEAVDSKTSLSDGTKLTYLKSAVKDKSALSLIMTVSSSPGQYSNVVSLLKDKYDQPRLIHRNHVEAISGSTLRSAHARDLREFYDLLTQHLAGLQATGQATYGATMTSLIVSKLPPQLREQWRAFTNTSKKVPDVDVIMRFMKDKLANMSTLTTNEYPPSRSEPKRAKASVHVTSNLQTCKLCKGEGHPLHVCPSFKSFSYERKITTIQEQKLCYNCLRPGHTTKACRSLHKCKMCNKSHHTSIHREEQPPAPTQSQPVNVCSFVTPTTEPREDEQYLPDTLQMTSQVIVMSLNGRQVKARALLDSGASISLITQRLAQQLQLPKRHRVTTIAGVQGVSTEASQHITTFTINPSDASVEPLTITAAIVQRVTANLPLHAIKNTSNWTFLQGLTLADPTYATPGRIDMILGTNVFHLLMKPGMKHGTNTQPTALNTIFGWAITGPYTQQDQSATPTASCCSITSPGTDDLLKAFWIMEEVSSEDGQVGFTPEERSVVAHFHQTHVYMTEGRYQVTLPKRQDHKPLGESRSQAVQRYITNERSIDRKGIKELFQKVVKEYLDLGHAELIPPNELDKPFGEIYYLPMHAVHKSTSTTTKLRVVFDASARTQSGTSLNDTLLVGPTVYPTLVDIMLRFRQHRIALTSDISKMYRAVELSTSDRDLHRFVWRKNVKDELHDYRMRRVTFGVAASPFVATQALQQVGTDFGRDFPHAAAELKRSFYVDDCLTGTDTFANAITLRQQLQQLLSKGNFVLRKWRCNSKEVMDVIPPELHETNSIQIMPGDVDYQKTLGIHWDSTKDQFYVSTPQRKPTGMLTKRSLCSDVARVFDVMGWFAPTTIAMKVLFQSLWEERLDWDEEVPSHIKDAWEQWRDELPLLNTLPISRPYFARDALITNIELHGFADASERAYAAVVYLKAVYSDHPPTITLVTAKTKVAPIKRLTIPRLELCGALLLARLLTSTRKALGIDITQTHAWTDSTVVINWLSGNPKHYRTYVGNRISDILELVPSKAWKHVSTKDNPADCASRGILPQELIDHVLWWKGPPWLQLPPTEWPPQPDNHLSDKGPEARATCNIIWTPAEAWLIDKCSSFLRINRILAWILRFTRRCQSQTKGRMPPKAPTLLLEELQEAERLLLYQSQRRCFKEDIEQLMLNAELKGSSSLLPLRPFLDGHHLLRVGGRLSKAPFHFTKRHPIILHSRDRLTRLIITHIHLSSMHAGPTLLLSLIGRNYHVMGVKKLVRSICRKCVTCRKVSARPCPQLMGQLPPERVTPGSTFDVVGVDFAGPVYTKYGHTRKPVVVKTYVCVFVSFTVKAVHLEAVSNLTTDAFLAAFRRFIARRGKPREVYSDNGTNFVGASREIAAIYELLANQTTKDTISDYATTHGITWRFSPERAPHFGGLWEAAVKAMKTHLRKCMGETRYTYEELSTVLCQIEACLNSRPLCAVSIHDEDGVECLTPGHFLIGKPLQAIPENTSTVLKTTLLKRWNLCQSTTHEFWQRWSGDYIASLRQLAKWRKPTQNIKIGDLVLIQEDAMVATRWPIARVVDTHPGNDSQVRVATVKTAKGTYKRPIAKLALLLTEGD